MNKEKFDILIIGDLGNVLNLANLMTSELRKQIKTGIIEAGMVRIETDKSKHEISDFAYTGKNILAIKIQKNKNGIKSIKRKSTSYGICIEEVPFLQKHVIADFISNGFLSICTLDNIQKVRHLKSDDNICFVHPGVFEEKRYIVTLQEGNIRVNPENIRCKIKFKE